MWQFLIKRCIESFRSLRQFPLVIFFESMQTNFGLCETGQRNYCPFSSLYWNCILSLVNSQTVAYFDKQHVSWNTVSLSKHLLMQCSLLNSKILLFGGCISRLRTEFH
jgi:hypothetical protein